MGESYLSLPDETNIESTKGGFSGASKRAAVVWNIGRYLYQLEEQFIEVKDKGDNYINQRVKVNGQDQFVKGYWNTPNLPDWALPANSSSSNSKPNSNSNQKPNQPSKPNTNANENTNSNSQSGNEPQGNSVDADHQKEYKAKLLNGIAGMQNILELNDAYIIALFNQATKNSFKAISAIGSRASIEDLESYYNALRPVAEVKNFSQQYNIHLETIYNYVQIVKNITVKDIMQLFFKLTREDLQEIKNICEAEMSSQQRGA